MTDVVHHRMLSVVRRMLITQYHRLTVVQNSSPRPTGVYETAAKLAFDNVENAIRVLDAALGEGLEDRRIEPGLEEPIGFFDAVSAWAERHDLGATAAQIVELTEAYDQLLRVARPRACT
jgi:hypothetical protein